MHDNLISVAAPPRISSPAAIASNIIPQALKLLQALFFAEFLRVFRRKNDLNLHFLPLAQARP